MTSGEKSNFEMFTSFPYLAFDSVLCNVCLISGVGSHSSHIFVKVIII